MDNIIRPCLRFLRRRQQLGFHLWLRKRGPRGAGDRVNARPLGTRSSARRGAPLTLSSNHQGTQALQALGGLFPVNKGPSPRGATSPCPIPGPFAAPPHGQRARCTGVARAPGTVSISAGPASLARALPLVRPPCLPACTARPPPWAREPGQFKHRDGAARGLGLRL